MAVFGTGFWQDAVISPLADDGFWADFTNGEDATITDLLDAWSDFMRPTNMLPSDHVSFVQPDTDLVANSDGYVLVTAGLPGIVGADSPEIGENSYLRAFAPADSPAPDAVVPELFANAGDFFFDFDNGEIDPAVDHGGFAVADVSAYEGIRSIIAWAGGWDDLADGYDAPQGDDNFF